MNRTRRRRKRKRTRRRRRRGGFKFKTPKFKMPKFKKPKLNITKKLGKMKDFGKKGLSAVGSVGKKGLGAVGKVGKMGMGAVGKVGKMGMGAVGKMGKMAMANPMMAGLGGLGAAGALLASMGGIPAGQFSKIAKIGGMMVAPLLLLGSFLKPGASFVYQGLKQVVTVAIKSGKGGFTFIINMVGMPIKALMGLLGNMPMLMAGMGGFAALAVLVSKNYMTWIWKSWKFIVDGWASAPLFTWCEKREDGTCRCPQILSIKKENGKPIIVVEDKKQESSAKKCFMNRQCPGDLICKKKHAWSPRGLCSKPGAESAADPAATAGKSCFMNRQCPGDFICKKKHAWSPRGTCSQPSAEIAKPKKKFFSSGEGKGCFMNKQCPSGSVCKKKHAWSPRGKCTQSGIAGVTQPAPMVTPPGVETAASLAGTKAMAGGRRLKTMWKLEGKTTGNGILIKINKKSSRRRTRRKRGGASCPPVGMEYADWYKEIGDCKATRKTASGRTYDVPFPDDRACCAGQHYKCVIKGKLNERTGEYEPFLGIEEDRNATCEFTGVADPDLPPPPVTAADFPPAPSHDPSDDPMNTGSSSSSNRRLGPYGL